MDRQSISKKSYYATESLKVGYTHTMFSEIHCIVQGKVQGVGYRDFVDTYAKMHGLLGWIKNNENGTVEIVMQGTPDMLKECIEMLQEGSLLAKVDSCAIDWKTPAKLFDSFRVIAS